MALHTDTKIFKVTYDLSLLVTKLVANMPRNYKADFGADLRKQSGAWVPLYPGFATLPKPLSDLRYHGEFIRGWNQCLREVSASVAAPAAGDALELKRKTDLVAELSKIIHNMTVAQQAAWIEWQHGAGAEAGMQWIENGLAGPGQIPDADEPYGTEAQAYFDANQADPLPVCHCGRPSNILHMGNGYCSDEHYRAAIAAQLKGRE